MYAFSARTLCHGVLVAAAADLGISLTLADNNCTDRKRVRATKAGDFTSTLKLGLLRQTDSTTLPTIVDPG